MLFRSVKYSSSTSPRAGRCLTSIPRTTASSSRPIRRGSLANRPLTKPGLPVESPQAGALRRRAIDRRGAPSAQVSGRASGQISGAVGPSPDSRVEGDVAYGPTARPSSGVSLVFRSCRALWKPAQNGIHRHISIVAGHYPHHSTSAVAHYRTITPHRFGTPIAERLSVVAIGRSRHPRGSAPC